MAPARKRGSGGRTSQPNKTSDRPAELTDTEREQDHNAEQARAELATGGAVDENLTEPASAPKGREPVREYRTPPREPMRAAGHILTDRGWELDTTKQEG